MSKKEKVKELEKPKDVQIQYEPYEKYLTRVLINIHNKLDSIEKTQQVIKERIVFEAKERDNTNG